jgi:hypothetical protein
MYTAHNLHSVCASDAAADVFLPETATVGGTSVVADDTVCATVDTSGEESTVVVCVVVCSVVVTDLVTVVTESVVTAIPIKIAKIFSVESKQANNIHICFSSSN